MAAPVNAVVYVSLLDLISMDIKRWWTRISKKTSRSDAAEGGTSRK
jgi:hypothetical protein